MPEVLNKETRLAQLNAEIEAENLAKIEAEKNKASEEEKKAADLEKDKTKSAEEIALEEKEKADKLEAEKGETEEQKLARIEAEKEKDKAPEKTWEQLLEEDEANRVALKKQARLEKLQTSKMANLFLELEEEGKSIEDIASIASKLKGFDTKDLTDEQLFMLIVADEKNADGEALSEEEKAYAYKEFKELKPSVQKTALEAKRAEVETKRNAEVEKLTNDKKTALTKVNECLPLIKSKSAEIYGKEINGVLMTHELTKEFNLEASRQLIGSTDAKGDINTELAIKNALKIVLFDTIEANAKEAGIKAGKEEAFKVNHNPSEDGKIAKSASVAKKTTQELEDDALAAYRESRNPQRKKVLTIN
jgi:hypothetical protein